MHHLLVFVLDSAELYVVVQVGVGPVCCGPGLAGPSPPPASVLGAGDLASTEGWARQR